MIVADPRLPALLLASYKECNDGADPEELATGPLDEWIKFSESLRHFIVRV